MNSYYNIISFRLKEIVLVGIKVLKMSKILGKHFRVWEKIFSRMPRQSIAQERARARGSLKSPPRVSKSIRFPLCQRRSADQCSTLLSSTCGLATRYGQDPQPGRGGVPYPTLLSHSPPTGKNRAPSRAKALYGAEILEGCGISNIAQTLITPCKNSDLGVARGAGQDV